MSDVKRPDEAAPRTKTNFTRRTRRRLNKLFGQGDRARMPRIEPLETRKLLSAYALATIATFEGTNGAGSEAPMTFDSSGNLFGTGTSGGDSSAGSVFEIAAGSSSIVNLASFNNTNGADPYAAVTLDSSGDLFGTSNVEGPGTDGTLFEIVAGSGSITTVVGFSDDNNGANPYDALAFDGSGDLFGTTITGGAGTAGTVFEIAAGSTTISTIASFNGINGSNPYAGVVLDSSGDLFGTTVRGGNNGNGAVYEVVAGSSSITTLASFDSTTTGSEVQAGVVLDSSGDLFGTTSEGGPNAGGTVYEVVAASGSITTLANFNGTNGSYPQGGVILDSSGDLFGATSLGGTTSDGTIFEVAAGSSSITTLANFNNTDGANPDGGLTLDSSGDLFGTASAGGDLTRNSGTGDGTVFELTPLATPTLGATGGNGQVTLSWGAVSSATSYDIYRSTTSGGEGSTPYKTDITGTSYPDTGVTNGTRYYYQLTAVSNQGTQSNKSTQASVLTAPLVTPSTATLSAGATSIVISGSGFSSTAASNTVTFNDSAVGAVTAATATSLTVTFSVKPANAGSLTAAVTSAGLSSGSPVQVATVVPLPVNPTVTSNIGNLLTTAARVVISGTAFDPASSNNTVTFNDGAVGNVSAATSTSLTVTFSTKPTQAGSLTAVVTTDGRSSGSPVEVATVTLPPVPPTVTPSTAALAANSTSIVINGTGFDSNAANDIVTFNDGAVGAVAAASATALAITFSTRPVSADSLTAVVASDAQSSGSPVQVATVGSATLPAPTVTANTAGLSSVTSSIVIAGTNFDPTADNDIVTFNDSAVGTVAAATATSLTVTFSSQPASPGSLTATVTTDDVSSGAPVQVATIMVGVTAALSAAPNPATAGSSVILTATVAHGVSGPVPSGTVTFFDGSTELGSSAMDEGSLATLTTASLPVGTDSITAAYSGDSNYLPSKSPAVLQVINPTQDLTASLAVSGSTSVISGTPLKLREKLTLTPAGAQTGAAASATILLSPNETAGASVFTLASTAANLSFKNGRARRVAPKLAKSIGGVAPGTYHLLIHLTDTTGAVATYDSGQTLTVVAPVVDLAGSVNSPATVKAAKRTVFSFFVTNSSSANVAAIGTLPFDISTSPDGLLSDATPLLTGKKHINLKPGRSIRITFVAELSATTNLVLELDPGNVVFPNDINTADEIFSKQAIVM